LGEDGLYWTSYGIGLRVNVPELTEKIYVAPRSQPWVLDLVERVAERYGLSKKLVLKSSIDDPALV
jgi:hypothetical protein